jgi:hypothetical protein
MNSQPDPPGAIVSLWPFDSQRFRAAFTPASVVADRVVDEHGGACCANGVAFRGRCSSPASIVVGEPLRRGQFCMTLDTAERGAWAARRRSDKCSTHQCRPCRPPVSASRGLGRFAATPASCPTQTSVSAAPTFRTGRERAQRCRSGVMVPDWSNWPRVGCARSPFGMACAAIPESILTGRECHDPGARISPSEVCWF